MLTIVAAVSRNGVIGQHGGLPWHLPEDLARYKELTMGKVVVMGRKTWESIPEKFRPLPGRTNVVVTRQEGYGAPTGVEVFHSLQSALQAHTQTEIIINGGAEIYREAMPLVDRLEITHVHQDVYGDAFFPSIDASVWKETKREDREGFSFVTYDRRI